MTRDTEGLTSNPQSAQLEAQYEELPFALFREVPTPNVGTAQLLSTALFGCGVTRRSPQWQRHLVDDLLCDTLKCWVRREQRGHRDSVEPVEARRREILLNLSLFVGQDHVLKDPTTPKTIVKRSKG